MAKQHQHLCSSVGLCCVWECGVAVKHEELSAFLGDVTVKCQRNRAAGNAVGVYREVREKDVSGKQI